MSINEKVKEFSRAAGQPTPERPTIPDPKTRILRARLIFEELVEYCDAAGIDAIFTDGNNGWDIKLDKDDISFKLNANKVDIVGVADSQADLSYVVEGMGISYGIDTEAVFDLVHENNMSKFPTTLDEYGKVMKNSSYKPLDLTSEIERQIGLSVLK